MKTNKFKKAILAVTLAALIVMPTTSFAGTGMTANATTNAPFCADTDGNGAYNIRENLIYVSRSWYEATESKVSVSATNKERGNTITDNGKRIVSNGEITGLQPLAKYAVNFDVYGADLVEADFKDLGFIFEFKNHNSGKAIARIIPSVVPDTLDGHKFHVSFEFVAKGISCTFKSELIPKLDIATEAEATIQAVPENEDFYKIEAKPADGEKLFIRIKYDPSISWGKMEQWAKRLCVYANSLSKTTGVNLGTLYMDFDYEGDEYGVSINSYISIYPGENGYVGFSPDASDKERMDITSGRNVITWSALHEMAHSYGANTYSEFENNYIFRQPEKDGKKRISFDEYLTNARGLTAIQNCDNLHNTDVHYRHYYDPKNNYYIDYYGKYNEIAQTVAYVYPNNYFEYAKNLTINFTWEELEEFFAAESDNDPDFVASREVAKWLNDKLDMNIPYTENYLKFANNFRKLAVIKYGNYDEASLNNVRARIGRNLIKAVIKDLKLDEF